MMNYENAAIVLWHQDGNRNKFRDADETTRKFYLDRAHDIVVVAVGDKVLYEVEEISTRDAFVNGGMLAIDAVNGKHQGVLVQVYPEVEG